MIRSGADLTKFNEGLTLVAKLDRNGKFVLGHGCDYWNGVPVVEGQTCTEEEADAQFDTQYELARLRALDDLGPRYWAPLSDQRRAVLTDMAFEIGGKGLSQFVDMLAAVRAEDWNEAARALRDSKLFDQVPMREGRNIDILLSGEWPQEG